ncbi:MAG: hypothetical protein SCK57_11535 [Bacillota bacterium]|nr:hypothetical protein [Bacillota bacterium]MDW7678283.1 hypothetical protein [Bacillota bacterium]
MSNITFASKINRIRKRRRPLRTGVAVGLFYLLIYLISIEHLFWSRQPSTLLAVSEPFQRMLVMRAPFLWEPVIMFTLFGITLFVSPLNLVLGGVLGMLVGANIMVAVYSYQYRKICRIDSGVGLAGILPGVLSGFACCAPTFIIALAPALSSFTVFFLQVQPFLIPFSLFVMVLGLCWSVSRLPIS